MSWLTKGIGSYKASPEKHKDDQGGTRNPYKCMNVMKQDATNDKIIERCKTCGKQISQQEKCYAYRSQNTHTLNKSN